MRKIYHSFSMISLSLIILVSIFLIQNAEAENSSYHNSENHFSFKIPDGWMEVPQNGLDENIELLEYLSDKANMSLSDALRPVAIFQLKKTTDWFDYPRFKIGIDRKAKLSKSKIRKLIASGELKEVLEQGYSEGISEVKRFFPSIVKNLKVEEASYDGKRNLFLMKNSLSVAEIGKITFLVVQFWSNKGTINLAFYSLEDDFQKYLVDFSEVVDSFKYDPGYECK